MKIKNLFKIATITIALLFTSISFGMDNSVLCYGNEYRSGWIPLNGYFYFDILTHGGCTGAHAYGELQWLNKDGILKHPSLGCYNQCDNNVIYSGPRWGQIVTMACLANEPQSCGTFAIVIMRW